jgi:hypothetical protein
MNNVILVLIAGVLIVIGVLQVRQLFKGGEYRTAASLRKIASSMSLSFVGDTQPSYFSSISRFPLFQLVNNGRGYGNLFTGKHLGAKVSIFDYSYRLSIRTPPRQTPGQTLEDQRISVFDHTAVWFVDERLDLPEFELRPEGIIDKFRSAFKMEEHSDIDFADHPKFSKRFLLRGPHVKPVAELFTVPVISHFEQANGKIYVEGKGENLMIYVERLVAPSKMQEFFEQCLGVHSCFVDSVCDS